MPKLPEEVAALVMYGTRLTATVRVITQAIENDDCELFGYASYELHELVKPGELASQIVGIMFNGYANLAAAVEMPIDEIYERYKEAMAQSGFVISSE